MIKIVVAREGGVARRSELLAITGLHPRALDRELARLVANDQLVRPRRGLIALPDVPDARLAAASVGGVVTCVSAAQEWDLPLLANPASPHVAVPRTTSGAVRGLVADDVVFHWDIDTVPSRRRPEPAHMFRHLVRCLPLREAVAAADAALRRGIVSLTELEALRPVTGWAQYERLLRAVDRRSQSIGESMARVALIAAGLRVVPQVRLAGVGHVDMVVEGVLVVEIDGFAYHSGRREYREDRRRDRVIAIRHGLSELRFSYEDAVFETDQLVDDVHAAVARHRSRVSLRQH